MISNEVWNNNTYSARWEFIVNKIRIKNNLPYKNEIDLFKN